MSFCFFLLPCFETPKTRKTHPCPSPLPFLRRTPNGRPIEPPKNVFDRLMHRLWFSPEVTDLNDRPEEAREVNDDVEDQLRSPTTNVGLE